MKIREVVGQSPRPRSLSLDGLRRNRSRSPISGTAITRARSMSPSARSFSRNTGSSPTSPSCKAAPLALQAALTKQADVGIVSYEHILTVAVQGKRSSPSSISPTGR